MALRCRRPLQDLPLEQFSAAGPDTNRKHKRPLSPSRSPVYNPAKRRILDVEGISNAGAGSFASRLLPSSFHGAHFATSSRSSGRQDIQKHVAFGSSDCVNVTYVHEPLSNPYTAFPSAGDASISQVSSQSIRPENTHTMPSFHLHACSPESSVDRQSRHYPGFDVYRDSGLVSPVSVDLPPENMGESSFEDEEHKENVPPRRKMKKTARSRCSNSRGEGAGLRFCSPPHGSVPSHTEDPSSSHVVPR